MPNMSLKKNEMPSQDPNVRNKNFLEVMQMTMIIFLITLILKEIEKFI